MLDRYRVQVAFKRSLERFRPTHRGWTVETIESHSSGSYLSNFCCTTMQKGLKNLIEQRRLVVLHPSDYSFLRKPALQNTPNTVEDHSIHSGNIVSWLERKIAQRTKQRLGIDDHRLVSGRWKELITPFLGNVCISKPN